MKLFTIFLAGSLILTTTAFGDYGYKCTMASEDNQYHLNFSNLSPKIIGLAIVASNSKEVGSASLNCDGPNRGYLSCKGDLESYHNKHGKIAAQLSETLTKAQNGTLQVGKKSYDCVLWTAISASAIKKANPTH